jgi:DNA polymerase I-like protein with 3'-5' exonuclease and polymerase domains
VLPILNPGNFDWAYTWLIKKWIRWGWSVARGKLGPIAWPSSATEPGPAMWNLLQHLRQAKEVAVDIEGYSPASLVTAIGLACDGASVSVPWDSYNTPSGHTEAGYSGYEMGERCAQVVRDILADPGITKVFHNGAFDVPILQAQVGPVSGPIEDTLLAHRVAYPQYRHGLQVACATEFLVEPWKELFHIDGQNKADPDFWISRPDETRRYNVKDSFATWLLWQSLKGRIGL